MAKIVDKAFDATKRIIRSVFVGTPNLFTTSDVNRQLEGLKYQLDQLDDKVGVLSDMTWQVTRSGNTFTVTPSFNYLITKGCDFSSVTPSTPVEVVVEADVPMYLCLCGETEEVTYEDDSTHEIAGAKFEDGTSKPAANQLRYKGGTIEIRATDNPMDEEDCIAILAKLRVMSSYAEGEYLFEGSTIRKEDSNRMQSSLKLQEVRDVATGMDELKVGDSYSEALNKLAAQIRRKIVPVGVIEMWAGSISQLPADYLLCNGLSFDPAVYPELNTVLGGATTPDLSGRFIVGLDRRSDRTSDDYYNIGNTGGEETHTLTAEESGLPAHTHKVSYKVNLDQQGGGGWNMRLDGPDSSGATGYKVTEAMTSQDAQESHENRPPYYVLAYIIKAK